MSFPDDMGQHLAALEERFGQSAQMVATFEGEMARLRETAGLTAREVGSLSNGLSHGLRRAFDGLVFDGMKLEEALKGVAQTIIDTVYRIAMKPVSGAAGGALAETLAGVMGAVSGGLIPFAKGGSFSQGRVMPFAQGGIVSGPVSFPLRGGRGLMGEAGPEAIMPLARGADGRLGVATSGGPAAVHVVMNVTTPDVQGFQRSQSQIAAQLARALGRGQRNR